jgi:hypothetical protein
MNRDGLNRSRRIARTGAAALCAGAVACLAATVLGCGSGSAAGPQAATASPPWQAARIATGAVLSYPPSWRLEQGDPGTATAVLRGTDNRLAGYLNLTPRQADETPADWISFRLAHNAHEGERGVRREPLGPGGGLPPGRGTCVRDSYTTATGARYVEVACLLGGRAESVVVAAAPPGEWSRLAPVLQRAIDDVHT